MKNIRTLFALLSLPLLAATTFNVNAATALTQNYNNLSNGLYTDKKAFVKLVGSTWANGFKKTGDSKQTTNRISGDNKTYVGSSGLSVKILYPKGKNDSKPSGAQWQTPLDKQYTDIYFSYWVKPQASADFGKGGKLPGVGGIVTGNADEDEWSGKLMWRLNGALEFYMHVPGAPEETSYLWNYGGSQAKLTAGQWNHIQVHYKLNTPGKADGVLEGWLNGTLKGKKTGFKFSSSTKDKMKIDYFFFSTFYGGDASYAPKSDQYFWFDEVSVTTTKQTYNASTPKK